MRKMKDTVIQVEEGKVSSAWNHDANQSYLTLRQFLQPSLITMALCGCYTFGKKSVRIIGITYRIIYLLFCLAACAKTIAAFTTLSTPSSLVNLTITLWYTQCLTMFLISLKSTHTKYGGQRKAFEFWDEKIRPEIEALEIEFPENKLKKRQTIYLIVATVLNVMNFLGSLLLHTDVITEGIGTIFAAPFAKTIPALAFSVFLLTLIQAVWLFPMFYIMLISTILTTTFEEFNKFLNKHIEQNCSAMIYKFQKIRQLHLNLCKMVSQCDQDFGWYFATIFVFSIGSTCFVLYVLLKIPMDFVNVLVFVFWLVSSLTLLGALSVSAAFVNEAAHGALDSIYNICVKDISTEQLGQILSRYMRSDMIKNVHEPVKEQEIEMHLFLFKLTGTQVGFTTLGLLTITKEFLLTIAGVFLTYFFLLYTL